MEAETQKVKLKKNPPKCSRCRNHGKLNLLKGHKYYCEYRNCTCSKCSLVKERTDVMQLQKALMKEEKPTRKRRRECIYLSEDFNKNMSLEGETTCTKAPQEYNATVTLSKTDLDSSADLIKMKFGLTQENTRDIIKDSGGVKSIRYECQQDQNIPQPFTHSLTLEDKDRGFSMLINNSLDNNNCGQPSQMMNFKTHLPSKNQVPPPEQMSFTYPSTYPLSWNANISLTPSVQGQDLVQSQQHGGFVFPPQQSMPNNQLGGNSLPPYHDISGLPISYLNPPYYGFTNSMQSSLAKNEYPPLYSTYENNIGHNYSQMNLDKPTRYKPIPIKPQTRYHTNLQSPLTKYTLPNSSLGLIPDDTNWLPYNMMSPPHHSSAQCHYILSDYKPENDNSKWPLSSCLEESPTPSIHISNSYPSVSRFSSPDIKNRVMPDGTKWLMQSPVSSSSIQSLIESIPSPEPVYSSDEKLSLSNKNLPLSPAQLSDPSSLTQYSKESQLESCSLTRNQALFSDGTKFGLNDIPSNSQESPPLGFCSSPPTMVSLPSPPASLENV